MGFWPFGKKKGKSKFAQTSASESKVEPMTTTARLYQLDLPAVTSDDDPFSDDLRAVDNPHLSSYVERTVLPVLPDPDEVVVPQQGPSDPRNSLLRRSSSGSAEDITALPIATELERSPHLRPVPDATDKQLRGNVSGSVKQHGANRSSTIRSKGSVDSPGLFRRRTNQARKDDSGRAEQVKAMGAPIDAKQRSSTEGNNAQRRESKRAKQNSNRGSNPPDSSVSLPYIPADLSSLAAAEHHFRFNVGSMAVFSPRPTIRHIEGSDYGTAPPRLGTPSRGKNRKDERQLYSRSTLNGSKRIDHLADGLDAGTIREVMEREQKRQDKKRKADEERAMRKLQRRADKQRAQEKELPKDWSSFMYQHAADASKNYEDKAIIPDTPTRSAPNGNANSREVLQSLDHSSRLNTAHDPFADFDGEDSKPVIAASTEKHVTAAPQIEILPNATILPASSKDDMRNISNLSSRTVQPSLSALESASRTDIRRESDMSATLSDDSSSKGGGWTALFRRNRLSSEEPVQKPPSEASYSVASRDSLSRQGLPAHLRKISDTQDSPSSPGRVTSIFHEDLPESPHSRSSSAVGPGLTVEPAVAIPPRSELRPLSNRGSISRMARRSMEQTMSESPTSSVAAGSGVAMAQSLASVDSEASWLSGKPKKTLSQQTMPGTATLVEQPESDYPSYEDSGAPDEEQNRRITPGPEPSWLPTAGDSYSRPALAIDTAQTRQGQSEVPEQIVHGEVAHSAIIMPPQNKMKSQEGLLNTVGSDDDIDRSLSSYSGEDGDGEVEVVNATIQKSPSVSVATHARQVSAGSAKLLDMQQELEPALERATSVSYSSHARQVSAGSAKLLDIASTPRKSFFEEK